MGGGRTRKDRWNRTRFGKVCTWSSDPSTSRRENGSLLSSGRTGSPQWFGRPPSHYSTQCDVSGNTNPRKRVEQSRLMYGSGTPDSNSYKTSTPYSESLRFTGGTPVCRTFTVSVFRVGLGSE